MLLFLLPKPNLSVFLIKLWLAIMFCRPTSRIPSRVRFTVSLGQSTLWSMLNLPEFLLVIRLPSLLLKCLLTRTWWAFDLIRVKIIAWKVGFKLSLDLWFILSWFMRIFLTFVVYKVQEYFGVDHLLIFAYFLELVLDAKILGVDKFLETWMTFHHLRDHLLSLILRPLNNPF